MHPLLCSSFANERRFHERINTNPGRFTADSTTFFFFFFFSRFPRGFPSFPFPVFIPVDTLVQLIPLRCRESFLFQLPWFNYSSREETVRNFTSLLVTGRASASFSTPFQRVSKSRKATRRKRGKGCSRRCNVRRIYLWSEEERE